MSYEIDYCITISGAFLMKDKRDGLPSKAGTAPLLISQCLPMKDPGHSHLYLPM